MAGTGRKPFETTDVVPFGAGNERLRPPPSLGKPEKQAFLDLVTTTDPKQFRPSDLPLLCRWAELTVMAEQAAGELQAGGMVTADHQEPHRARPTAAARPAVENAKSTENEARGGLLLRPHDPRRCFT